MKLTTAINLLNALNIPYEPFKEKMKMKIKIVDNSYRVNIEDVANYIDIQLHLKHSQN